MADPEKLGYVERAKSVLQTPKEFFKGLKKGDFGDSITYYAIISFVTTIVATILGGPATAVGAAIAAVLVGLFFLFVGAAIVNFVAGLLEGKGDFSLTFKVMCYAATASMVGNAFNILPILGALVALVGSLYSFYLNIIGLAEIQKFDTWKALVSLVVPGIVVAGVVFVFTFLVAGTFALGAFGLGLGALGAGMMGGG